MLQPIICSSAVTLPMENTDEQSQNDPNNQLTKEVVNGDVALRWMPIVVLAAKAKQIAQYIVKVSKSLNHPAADKASTLLQKSLIDLSDWSQTGLQYRNLVEDTLMESMLAEDPQFRLTVVAVIEEMLAFLEQHRYSQRNHHYYSMFYQGI